LKKNVISQQDQMYAQCKEAYTGATLE
jgi:hypothetical protein